MKYIIIITVALLLWVIAVSMIQVKLEHPKWSVSEIVHYYIIYNK